MPAKHRWKCSGSIIRRSLVRVQLPVPLRKEALPQANSGGALAQLVRAVVSRVQVPGASKRLALVPSNRGNTEDSPNGRAAVQKTDMGASLWGFKSSIFRQNPALHGRREPREKAVLLVA